MEVVKSTDEYTIYKKRSNRYAVKNANKAYVNGEEKTKLLAEADLIKLSKPNPNKTAAEDTPAQTDEVEAADGDAT